ncbi:MAG: hypothetical protein JF618_11590, partial [Leifsonia sp.]|nr:hypothetical protein [Leifsonia sp.]
MVCLSAARTTSRVDRRLQGERATPSGRNPTQSAVATQCVHIKRSQVSDTKKLVIVESPNKVKSIAQYLGDGYEVMASVGHIRDLIEPKNLP